MYAKIALKQKRTVVSQANKFHRTNGRSGNGASSSWKITKVKNRMRYASGDIITNFRRSGWPKSDRLKSSGSQFKNWEHTPKIWKIEASERPEYRHILTRDQDNYHRVGTVGSRHITWVLLLWYCYIIVARRHLLGERQEVGSRRTHKIALFLFEVKLCNLTTLTVRYGIKSIFNLTATECLVFHFL